MDEKKKALQVYTLLNKTYPDAKVALHFSNPMEMLVATILSAQCTDKRVNMVTPALFRKYKTAKDYANADIKELEQLIRSTGFYRAKARSIQGAAKMIVEQHNGKVPNTMAALLGLPGVARKTANIVLGNAYNIVEGIAVDTHVKRVTFRLGLTKHTDPTKIEKDLMALLPKDKWFKFTYLVIEHGRAVCKAPVPICTKCVLFKLCPRQGVEKYV
ncbi:endonuclease III [Candidatus Woesearchaeota archaeon]|nr:endonuclease III [Candidatus Woesearchaeota archaeon]